MPDWIKENKALFADKKWLRTVLVAFDVKNFLDGFLKEGFEDVAQLHGGIATYGKDPETKRSILGR